MAARSAPALRWGAPLVLTVLVLGGAALTLAIDAVPPLALAVITTVVLAYRRWVGWRLAMALALLGGLVGQALVGWLAPQIGWSLATATVVTWTAVGLGHAGLNCLAVPPPARWTRARAVDLGAALLVPAGLGVYFWLSAARSGPWISWAMANDAAPYALMTRRVLEDGGLLRAQENPAPLAGVLHATWAGPGADGLSPAGLVAHLLTTSAQLSLVGWALLGFLAAVVTLATTRGRWGTHVMVAAAAAALPWTWFIAQIAVNLGFTNAWPAMVVLVLAWCCWQQHAHHPVGSLTGQILATWAAVVSWGPIAIVPAAWLLATVLVERRALRAAGRALLLPGLTLVAAAGYAVVLTLPDLTRQGGNLAADGAAPAIERWWGLGVAVAVLVASVVPRTGMSRTVRIGIWFGVPAAGLGAAYLIRARAELPDWWGYYPAKFTWIALSALFLIAVGSLQHPARRLARRSWEGNGVLLVIAVILVVMAQVSQPGRPVTLASMFTPVQLRNPGYNDAAIPDLFDLMERDPKSIVARYSPVPGHDYFVNYWMLQLGAEDLDDQIRVDAYYMDSSNPASICTAIADWRGDVTVWTRDPKLEKRLERTCDPSLDYRVEVRPPLPAA